MGCMSPARASWGWSDSSHSTAGNALWLPGPGWRSAPPWFGDVALISGGADNLPSPPVASPATHAHLPTAFPLACPPPSQPPPPRRGSTRQVLLAPALKRRATVPQPRTRLMAGDDSVPFRKVPHQRLVTWRRFVNRCAGGGDEPQMTETVPGRRAPVSPVQPAPAETKPAHGTNGKVAGDQETIEIPELSRIPTACRSPL